MTGSYRAALAGLLVLWLVHLVGSFYDAFAGGGGPSYFWTGNCGTHGGLCVLDTRSGNNEYAGIRVGDQILEMGGVSALPSSHVGFRQALTPPFDGNMLVQRDEANVSVTIPIPQYDFMNQIAIKNLVLGLFAITLAFFAQPSRLALAATAILFLSGAAGQGAPLGPSVYTAHVLTVVNLLSQLVLWPSLCMALLLMLKPGVSSRQLRCCWGFAVYGCMLAMVYYPLLFAPSSVLAVYLVSFLLMFAILSAIVLRLYPKTSGRARRQANWAVGAFSVSALLITGAYFIGQYSSDELMRIYFGASELSFVVTGLAIIAAVLFDDIVPINKAAVVSVSYALVAVFFALTFEFILEPVVGTASTAIGVESNVGQTILIVLVTLTAPKLKNLITPFVEARILDQEEGLESGLGTSELH